MKARALRLSFIIVFAATIFFRPKPVFINPSRARPSSGALPSVASPKIPEQRTAIVVDHRHTDIRLIPDGWLEQAKRLTFHYAHTSHGSQIISGITWLEQQDPKYALEIVYGSEPQLPDFDGALRIYDGNDYGGDTYITPEMYWSTQEGILHTRAVAETGLFGFSMWAWCGQQSDNSDEVVQQYLNTLDDLESQYPAMRFIYMTGHTDGGSATLTRNNNMVRDFALANGKILFDFANIESYDPNGNFYPNTDDSCPWCDEWCNTHPQDCTDLPTECAHSHPLTCKLKGQAFWWMMARLAGWEGVSEDSYQKIYLPLVFRH